MPFWIALGINSELQREQEEKEAQAYQKLQEVAAEYLRKSLPTLPPGISVELTRIASFYKLEKEDAEKLLQELLVEQPELGEYVELAQVFIRSKAKEEPHFISEPMFQEHFHRYTCSKCGSPLTKEEERCSECGTEVLRYIVCKLPVSFGERVGKCSQCGGEGHLTHFQEWRKTEGKCPRCLQELIIEEQFLEAKK
ncbi:MAG: hypothetical protein GF308_18145 [Candidatus Heimdallarchaeota archaeon]|nr:hypothetical protein [Candidatus Heimdallarchaeota archaeon]